MNNKPNRRQFLASGAGVAGALTVRGVPAASAGVATRDAASRATVVLHDTRLAMDPGVAARLAANGAKIIALDSDPVRMWRGASGVPLRDPATRLLGLTRWADFLIVRGLAAESRRHLRYQSLDARTGTFIWLIA
jgi:hypothetical protein